MTKTYRVLRVVAIVALIVAALHAVYLNWWYLLHVPEEGVLFFLVMLATDMLTAVISIFSAVVAGLSRAWVWLSIFLVAGFLAWFGLPLLSLYLLRSDPQNNATQALNIIIYGQPIQEALLALLALVFVWLRLRANGQASGAAQAGQA
jgi:hypothetical protein